MISFIIIRRVRAYNIVGFKEIGYFLLVVEPSRILRMNKDHGQTHLVQNLQEQQERQATMTDGLSAGGGGDHRTNGHTRQQGTNKFENEFIERRQAQGSSLPSLAVLELRYQQNWIYVILSRVTTSKGLFLSEALSLNLDDYAMSRDIKEMISEFQSNIGLKFFENEEYDQMLTQDQHNRELRGMVSR
jgi:hypothetical protein